MARFDYGNERQPGRLDAILAKVDRSPVFHAALAAGAAWWWVDYALQIAAAFG
ncbi:hypothetical protein [Oceanicella actignis]|uniref:Uncharacterized protein n=1 Tax=Oceanicella actignis TaxID=1189325 RepID=A0A1M7U1T8_9RHOB|nr:hypothetical protein [Oceanicella actignis]SES76948.1 hypothetical protein SAMN04488119_101408 [Oceanicella actignis]SHN76873.1 hypothetical protein SAMN05216200_11414 [Oceanicella actignis]